MIEPGAPASVLAGISLSRDVPPQAADPLVPPHVGDPDWRFATRSRDLRDELAQLVLRMREINGRYAALLEERTRLVRDNSDLRRDNVRLAREHRRLRDQLSGKLTLKVESPTFKGGLGGRTAIEQFANTNLAQFLEHVNEVGPRAIVHGREPAKRFLSTVVFRDYEVLCGAPPQSLEEAQLRDDCRLMLTTDWGVEILSDPSDDGERARVDFMGEALRSCAASVSQELMRRSGEVTQARAPRPDDDEG